MDYDDPLYPCGYCPYAKIKDTGPFGEEYYECDIPEGDSPDNYASARCCEGADN